MRTPKPSDSAGEFVVPDPGTYKMEFTSYDEPQISTFKRDDGSDNWRIKLVFTIIDDDDYEGVEIFAWFGWTMSPKGKLYPVLKAMLGRDIEDDEDVELDDLVGKSVMGTLEHKTKTNENGTRTFANLIAVAPIRRKSSPAKPTPKAKPVEEDDGDELFDEAV